MNPLWISHIELMEKQGGSFVRSLADAYYLADPVNQKILVTAFAHIFDGYKRMYDNHVQKMQGETA
jgi:hypothetical protein